jgi:putative peptidoglycan lipid II flippase
MRMLLRRMVPGLVGAGVSQINLAMDTILGSLLPTGSVSLLYYADRVNQLPLGTIGIAVGTALLPLLSRQVRSGAETESLATLNRALEYALFLTIPAAVALIVAAVPIMEVLFVRGAFDSASAVGSAHALAAYAVGLPAFVLVKVLVPGFFARGDTATPVRVGLLSIGLNLALNLSLIWWLAHVGLALASSLAAMFNAGALAVLLQRRGHLAVDAQLRRRVPRMALAAAAMAMTLVAIERTVYAWLAPDHVLRWVGLFVLVGFGIGAYFIAAEILGACRIREMIQSFRRPAAS